MIPANQPHESDVAVDLIATLWVEPSALEILDSAPERRVKLAEVAAGVHLSPSRLALGFALLFGVAACDPLGAVSVIAIASVVYVIHGLTHVLRYFGLYYGDGTPIPTRPQVFEMRDGLQLLAAAIGMMLFAG